MCSIICWCLLSATEVPLSDVMTELERRFGIGGLKEKAARQQD